MNPSKLEFSEERLKSVLSGKMKAGPQGLGDPEDQSLRKVELEVMIPKLVREIAKKEKCYESKQGFDDCCIKNSYMMVVNCREENRAFQECMNRWFFDKKFVDECTEIYLAKRAEFRRTGIKQKTKGFER